MALATTDTQIPKPGPISFKAADEAIRKQYQAKLESVTLPRLEDLFSSGLSAQLLDATAFNGYASISAMVTASGYPSAGPTPQPLALSSSGASIGIASDQKTMQGMFRTLQSKFPISHPFDKQDTRKVGLLGHFGAGIKGVISLDLPKFAV